MAQRSWLPRMPPAFWCKRQQSTLPLTLPEAAKHHARTENALQCWFSLVCYHCASQEIQSIFHVAELSNYGIATADIKKLVEGGIHTVNAVANMARKELVTIKGLSDAKVKVTKSINANVLVVACAACHLGHYAPAQIYITVCVELRQG